MRKHACQADAKKGDKAGTNNRSSGKQKGGENAPQRTLARDGSLNELAPVVPGSREAGCAAGASGGAIKKKAREPSVPAVTPKTMLSLEAYLGAVYEFALIDYSSGKLYRVTTFDARIAFLYALHSKGNSALGIPGDSDMVGRSGVAVDADPQAWRNGGLQPGSHGSAAGAAPGDP